ncbi:BTB POZ domain-containing [Lecanosticta acicola]|uniref:BTB POZ domain-containing n=1 Tax=Lecanosticta acicola TaxID=111012 RepID=A0AAI8Z7N7_9PEZI|nr:BTB POZ domain-containing [Lecanosticta acicola]
MATFSRLLDDPKYSDLEIVCDGHVFRVHRNVVCSQSRVLERECDGNFQEANSRRIEHTVFDAYAVDRMLQFLYREDYVLSTELVGAAVPDQTCQTTNDAPPDAERNMEIDDRGSADGLCMDLSPFSCHVYVYAIADYYEIPALQALALQKFAWERSKIEGVSPLELLQIASVMYTNTNSDASRLRGQLLSMAYEHPGASFNNEHFLSHIQQRPELQAFCADLLAHSAQKFQAKRSELRTLNRQLNNDLTAAQDKAKKLKSDLKKADARVSDLKARNR